MHARTHAHRHARTYAHTHTHTHTHARTLTHLHSCMMRANSVSTSPSQIEVQETLCSPSVHPIRDGPGIQNLFSSEGTTWRNVYASFDIQRVGVTKRVVIALSGTNRNLAYWYRATQTDVMLHLLVALLLGHQPFRV